MLESTFIHLPGIGAKKERALWEQGIRTWDDLERASFHQARWKTPPPWFLAKPRRLAWAAS